MLQNSSIYKTIEDAAVSEGQKTGNNFLILMQIWQKKHSVSAEDLKSKAEDDSQYPDVPKNWGFMTLKRNRKK